MYDLSIEQLAILGGCDRLCIYSKKGNAADTKEYDDFIKKIIYILPLGCLIFTNEENTENCIRKYSFIRGIETFQFILPYPPVVVDLVISFTNEPLPQVLDEILHFQFTNGKEHNTTDELNKETNIKKNKSFQYIEDGSVTNDVFLNRCCESFSKDENNQCFQNETPQNDIVGDEKENRFLKAVLVEAKRCNYRRKKEEFKKQMRQLSTTSTKSRKNLALEPENKISVETTTLATKGRVKKIPHNKKCKAITKKSGNPCNNNALPNSEYCGIPSHKN